MAGTDFAPHNLTSNSSKPLVWVSSSNTHTPYSPWRAFDGNAGTDPFFLGDPSYPVWLAIKFGDQKQILDNYSVQAGGAAYDPTLARAPKDWVMQGSNDGSSWTTIDTVTGQTAWSNGEIRNFVCDTRTTAYSHFRISVSAVNGGAYVTIGELYLYADPLVVWTDVSPHGMTANSTAPYVASASTEVSPYSAYKAFDGQLVSTGGERWAGGNYGVDWLKIDLGGGQVVDGYTLRQFIWLGNTIQNPKDWTFQGSNDGATWTTLDTRSGQSVAADTQDFSLYTFSNSTAYRYYRLNITANNGTGGTGQYTTVGELYLWKSVTAPTAVYGVSGGVVSVAGGSGGSCAITGPQTVAGNAGGIVHVLGGLPGSVGTWIGATVGGVVSVLGGGTGMVKRALRGAIGGLVPVRGGATGAILPSTERLLTVFIAGTDRTALVMLGVTRSMQIGGGSKATCQFKLAQQGTPYRPEQGDEVVIWHRNGYRWFAGVVDNTSEYDYSGTAARTEITVNCVDFGALCDRAIIGREIQPYLGNLASILFEQVISNSPALQSLGLRYVFTWEPEVPLGGQIYNWLTATEVLNGICAACGGEWRVDFYKYVYLFPANTGYLSAPFSITDNDGNWIDMTVSRDSAKYRNRVGVRSSADVKPLWTDTFHGDGSQRIWATMSPLRAKPRVRVNGEPVTVVNFEEIRTKPYDFYWIGTTIIQNFSHPVLTADDTITASYPSPLSYVAWAQDDAEIAEHGLCEGIEEVKDVVSNDALQAIATAILARKKVRPITAQIQTDRDGLEPGMGVVVNTTRPALADTLMVTSVSSTEQGMKFFRHQVSAVNSANQAISNLAAFYQQVIARTVQPKDRVRQNIVFHLAETIEGLSNPGLTTGVKLAARGAPCDGYLSQCSLYFRSSAATPTTAEVQIDVLLNGVSIFGPTVMVWPAGETNLQVQTEFNADPFAVQRGDLFTVEVLAADPLATDGILEVELLVR